MKLPNTFFLLLSLALISNSYAQSEPDYKTTYEYIKKIFDETTGYEYITERGVVYKSGSLHIRHSHNVTYYKFNKISKNEISFGQDAPSGYCSYFYEYRNIDWAKMQSISMVPGTASNSPVKYLSISFTPNSILREGHTDTGCEIVGFKYFGVTQSVSHILFPYRDEEGVKERLIKALNHLSKLAKEEKAKNDPFGN